MIDKMRWIDAYSVGNRLLDMQHRSLLRIGGKAFEVLRAPSFVSRSDFHALLNDFADKQREHFQTEERVLARNGDPGLAAHIAEHDKYREKLTGLLYQADCGKLPSEAFLELIAAYTGRHLLRTDLSAKDYFKER